MILPQVTARTDETSIFGRRFLTGDGTKIVY
jgi:hypothetical protein